MDEERAGGDECECVSGARTRGRSEGWGAGEEETDLGTCAAATYDHD